MYLFGEENKRRINLGGASSASTSSSILDEARHRRAEREDRRKRHENAIRIQAWWRGQLGARAAKVHLRQILAQNPDEITALRCLVLLGKDSEALTRWSEDSVRKGPEAVYLSAKGPHVSSWLTLMRQVLIQLLRTVADSPTSPPSAVHLGALDAWLSPPSSASILSANGDHVTELLTSYVVRHGLYTSLSRAIDTLCKTPNSKLSTELQTLIGLSTHPFRTLSRTDLAFQIALSSLLAQVLTIPVLLNKLSTPSIITLSSGIPFQSLDAIIPDIPAIVGSTTLESKIHLLANFVTIAQPRYPKLPPAALDSYLRLLAGVLNALPAGAFNPPPKDTPKTASSQYDSDSEEERPIIVTHGFFNANSQPLPNLDPRTLKRLATLVSPSHTTALLSTQARTKRSFVLFLLALEGAWPEKQAQVLSAVLSYSGGGMLRELYRGSVRSSGIGRNDEFRSLSDPSTYYAWPALLFLADLYTRLLLTMGDDEFFQTSESISADHRNPFTLDEVTAIIRQFLNIAFVLYMREDQVNVQGTGPIMSDLRLSWEVVREKVKRCLIALHARDSRRRFTPPGHWHINSQLDMKPFIDAAIFEERELSSITVPASRSMSKRQTAYLSPRLAILNNIPFAIPFETRVQIFRHFVASDMIAQTNGPDSHSRNPMIFGRRRGTNITIRRDHVAQDGFDKLSEADLKDVVQITFIDQFGQEEAGIDGGGVFKEFFTSLCKEVFDTDRGLWLMTKNNELYPNPHAYAREPHSLNWYRFIGRILGKAMYEGILVDVAFAGFFLAKWLGKQSFLDDLASLDQELYSGLVYLKHYTGNPEDLSLNFTIAVEEFSVTHTIDLIPNGSNIPVTQENRLYYIQLVSQFRLSRQIKKQSDAFFDGLSEMMDVKWLRMFNQQEVQILISGVNSTVDLDDLRKHTNYGGLYDDNEETIVMFWKVINGFNHEQRRALLRFVTSCSRPPLLGFKELVPSFAIRDAGDDQSRLPTSSTCVNLLKLPKYRNERQMRTKLLQAINSGAGFDLS